MDTSERTQLRHRIASHLSAEQWHFLEDLLEEFVGKHGVSAERKTPEQFALEVSKVANDAELTYLAKHLGLLDDSSGLADTADDLWPAPGVRIFISHVSSIKQTCTLLSEHLSSYGITGFVAHHSIEPDRSWQQEIERALRTADTLVALLTDGFCESKWTDQEIGWALGRGIPVSAIRLPHDPHGFLAMKQGISVPKRDAPAIAEAIYNRIRTHIKLHQPLAYGLMHNLRSSPNFASANKIAARLNDIGYWDKSMSAALVESAKANNQVEHSADVHRFLIPKLQTTGIDWPFGE